MADKRSILDTLMQSALDRRNQAELEDAEAGAGQLENDTQAQDDIDYLTGQAPLPRPVQQMKDMGDIFLDSVTRGGFNRAVSYGRGSKTPGMDTIAGSLFMPAWAKQLQEMGILPTPDREERTEETDQARARAGMGGTVADVAGEVAPFLAGPAGRTVKGAMAIGGAESVISDSAEKAFKEDRPLGGVEALVDAGFGAGGGFVGKIVGDQLSNLFRKKGGEKTPITKGTTSALRTLKQSVDSAAKQMDDAQVMVKNSALKQLEQSILKSGQFQRWGFGAASSPEAWTAFNVLRAQVGRGKDMGLRELNEIRQTMRKLGKNTFLGIKIDEQLGDFIGKLDNTMVSSGDVAKGVAGWREMNKVHFKQKQSELLAKMLTNSEFVTRQAKNGITLDKALQDQFSKLFTTDAGKRKMTALKYSPEQVELIRDIAEGGWTTTTANRMDKLFGDTLIAPIYRLTLQPALRTAGAEQGARRAESLFEDVTGMRGAIAPAVPGRIGPQAGAGSGAALLQQLTGPQAAPGAVQPATAPAQAPVGSAPKVMPRALPDQSRSNLPPNPIEEIGR